MLIQIQTKIFLYGKTLKEKIKLASEIIKKQFVGKEIQVDNSKATITNRTAREYTHLSKTLDKKNLSK